MSGSKRSFSEMGGDDGAGGDDGKRPDKGKQPEQAQDKGKGKEKEIRVDDDEGASNTSSSKDTTTSDHAAVNRARSLMARQASINPRSEARHASINPRYLRTGLNVPKRIHPFPGNVPRYTRPAEVQAALERGGDLDDFVRYQMVIPASELNDYLLSRIALVRDAMGQGAGFEDAIRYLDYTAWDVGAALHQWRTDQYNRANPPADTDARESNRALDRSRVLMSDDAATVDSKLQFKVKKDGQWVDFDYRTSHPTFDPNNASDMLKANEARLRFIKANAGEQKPPGKGEWWSELEKRVLAKRYARKRYEPTGFPDYKGMTEDHNEMLDGAHLPGRSTAVPKRTHTQVSAQIDRAHIAHASSNKNRLTGTSEMIHTAAQGIVKAELKAQKKQMLDLASREDWGSSVQDLADAEMQDPDMYGPGAMEQAVQMAEEAAEDEEGAGGAAGEEFQIEDNDDDNVYLSGEDSEGAVEDRRPPKRRKHGHGAD